MDQIRKISRWIIVSFGAIATILIGTAPLDKIGAVDAGSSRFWIMTGAAAVTVLAVAVAIWLAAAVDEPTPLSMAELIAAEAGAKTWPKSFGKRNHIKGAVAWINEGDFSDVKQVCVLDASDPRARERVSKPIAFVNAERNAARDAWQQAQCEAEGEASPEQRAELVRKRNRLKKRFDRLDRQLDTIIDLGNYWRLQRRFNWRKRVITGCAVVAACGLMAFKYAVSTKPHDVRVLTGITLIRAIDVDLHGADLAGANLKGALLVHADLSSADLTGAQLDGANLDRANLDDADLTRADLTGAKNLTPEQVEDVTHWANATCPNGVTLHGTHAKCATRAQLTPRGG